MNEITKELLDALKSIMALPEHKVDRRDEAKAAREVIAKAEAILAAAQPADDGWIPWAGGARPVDTIVGVKLRNGSILMNFACVYDWRHLNDPVDIVAYRVVQQSEKTWG